ncbi:MAG: T9SS type A sorting domain-containing protein, partial [Bacteroidota bacterium]
ALQRVRTAQEEVLFSLVIRATEDAPLSEVLSVDSRYTQAEAYVSTHPDLPSPGKGEDLAELGIHFGSATLLADFALYQNTPNPFADETLIGFTLPEGAADEATLTILDAAGRLVITLKTEVTAGYNSVTLTKEQLMASGVLTYTITAGEYVATKQMIAL